MLSIVILHSANGIFQNSLFGIAANLPHKMTTAIMIGSNLCGIYTAVLALIAITSKLLVNTKYWSSII